MTFLRNCWYVAGFCSELGTQPIGRVFLDDPVVLYRGESGKVVAMDNRCPHRMAPLDKGAIFADDIQCPYHGLRFGPAGTCTRLPSGGMAPPRARLRVYPIEERHTMLWIWMGDPAAADSAKIPDLSSVEDPAFDWFDGYLHAKGNYQLLVDNLLDLSHSEFLHPMLSSPGWSARNQQTIEQDGDKISISNVALDDNILPLFAHLKPQLAPIGKTVQLEQWHLPSLVELTVNYYSGGDELIAPSAHLLTPETEKTTHYFVRAGQNLQPDNPHFTAGMREAVLDIFRTQDVPIIEAQQLFLGDGDLMEHDPAILRSDAGSTRARRTLKQRIREEQAASTGSLAAVSSSPATAA